MDWSGAVRISPVGVLCCSYWETPPVGRYQVERFRGFSYFRGITCVERGGESKGGGEKQERGGRGGDKEFNVRLFERYRAPGRRYDSPPRAGALITTSMG